MSELEREAALPAAAEPAPAAARLAALAPRIRALRPRVVIGVPGDDVHVVANKLAETLLAAVGYDVTNLGVLVPTAAFVDAVRELRPAALMLSSVNGHASLNCGDLPRVLRAAGLELPVYLGGNLSVGDEDWRLVEARFAALGFARVFAPTVDLVTGVAEISGMLLDAAAGETLLHSGLERHVAVRA